MPQPAKIIHSNLAGLAINGGPPIRSDLLPYGRQGIDQSDIRAVTEVLSSPWLTTGPKVSEFENAMCHLVQARYGVAVSSGTAALHAAVAAARLGPGDGVAVPTMTFAATANAVVYEGANPIFIDIDPQTLLIDLNDLEKKITPRTKAVIAVDYAGQACDYDRLRKICSERKLILMSDACHSLGAKYQNRPVGALAELTIFSFHPVKAIATGEGGMIVGTNDLFEKRLRLFRNHGISTDLHQREKMGVWAYEVVERGFNYRLSDIQCALGISQLAKLTPALNRRNQIASHYDNEFKSLGLLRPLKRQPQSTHAFHLYVIQLELEKLKVSRDEVYSALRAEGIGTNVHYIPVHLHPFYQTRNHTTPPHCPAAETAFKGILTLPLFPTMSDTDVAHVVEAVHKVLKAYRR